MAALADDEEAHAEHNDRRRHVARHEHAHVPCIANVTIEESQCTNQTEEEQKRSEDGGPHYPVVTGDYQAAGRWESAPVRAGTPLAAPVPLFAKLDVSVIDEELARLAGS